VHVMVMVGMVIVNHIWIGVIRIRGMVVKVTRIVIVVVIMIVHMIVVWRMVMVVILRLGSRRFWVRF